jgi:hypothetical protein
MEELIRFLTVRGATTIPHPGGTLLAHLRRTSQRLQSWGAGRDLQLLGLAHATYGTDGFGVQLLELSRRPALISIVGAPVEEQVYLYASCDRRATYPRLHDRPGILFTDRFTGEQQKLPANDLRQFAELTAANELDVLLHTKEYQAQHGAWLLGLLERMSGLLSAAARSDCRAQIAARSAGPRTGTEPARGEATEGGSGGEMP